MKKLPYWCLTDKLPAFYDTESATAIEQTAKVYGAMQTLVDEYNSFAETVNNSIEEFESGAVKDFEAFTVGIRQEFQDFIDVVNQSIQSMNVAIANQNSLIDERFATQDRRILNALHSSQTTLAEAISDFEKTMNSNFAAQDSKISDSIASINNSFNEFTETTNAAIAAQNSNIEEISNSVSEMAADYTFAPENLYNDKISRLDGFYNANGTLEDPEAAYCQHYTLKNISNKDILTFSEAQHFIAYDGGSASLDLTCWNGENFIGVITLPTVPLTVDFSRYTDLNLPANFDIKVRIDTIAEDSEIIVVRGDNLESVTKKKFNNDFIMHYGQIIGLTSRILDILNLFDGYHIESRHIGDSAILSKHIASKAVTEEKLNDGAVTEKKIGNGAVNVYHIANNAIVTRTIAANAVTEEKLNTAFLYSTKQVLNNLYSPATRIPGGLYSWVDSPSGGRAWEGSEAMGFDSSLFSTYYIHGLKREKTYTLNAAAHALKDVNNFIWGNFLDSEGNFINSLQTVSATDFTFTCANGNWDFVSSSGTTPIPDTYTLMLTVNASAADSDIIFVEGDSIEYESRKQLNDAFCILPENIPGLEAFVRSLFHKNILE